MHSRITIPRRFCGPPESGNGGYTAGSLARYVDGDAEVTLRRPPPLDRPLAVETIDGGARLLDGDTVIAEAVPTVVDIDPPAPVTIGEAEAAAARSVLVTRPEIHPFPSCFACGPERREGDGLRLFPGYVEARDVYAAPWVPVETDDAIIWAALDCPSSMPMYTLEERPTPHVLGRIAARITERPQPGVPHVIVSWMIGRDGRKLFSGTAIYGPDDQLCAVARATWIAVNAA